MGTLRSRIRGAESVGSGSGELGARGARKMVADGRSVNRLRFGATRFQTGIGQDFATSGRRKKDRQHATKCAAVGTRTRRFAGSTLVRARLRVVAGTVIQVPQAIAR